jgi:hypothetical protein
LQNAFASDSKATFAWLEAQPASPDRDHLVERALREWLEDHSGRDVCENGDVLKLYGDLPPEAQPRVAQALGEGVGQDSDFTDIQNWANHFEGNARNMAIEAVVNMIARPDPSAAEKLLDGLADPSDRDAALQGIALQLEDPDGVDRALQISDPTQRADTIEAIIDDWSSSEPAACRAWLALHASELPRDLVAAWQARLADK